jgi:L-aminopeptidase/D-esterase-like protein
MMATLNDTLTAVHGIQVGHATDLDALTGCTAILCPPGTVGGVDVRGGAPGTRETDLLRPLNHVQEVTAIMLAGGSAYGLAAADGAMRFLAERDRGYRTSLGYLVPIVPAAIIFDLSVGRADIYPTAEMGYAACGAASSAPVEQGCVGAGTGCRVGALYGNAYATKGGLGSAAFYIDDTVVVAALAVVNAVGDVIDEQGQILAGLRRRPDGDTFEGILNALRSLQRGIDTDHPAPGTNTVIGVVATNARLTKEQVNKVAQMAHDGLARAVNPAHTMYDGDTIFALATGEIEADVNLIGAYGAEVMASAVRRGVRTSVSLGGIRAWNG